ncbi:MAG: hypothetical protein ACI8RD_005020 [Bacillariaceae sp.]
MIDSKQHIQVALKEAIAEFWFAWELLQNYEKGRYLTQFNIYINHYHLKQFAPQELLYI